MTAFRFGVAAAATGGGAAWRDTARRAEELGYSVLLSPDNLHLPTPTASLAAAAAVTTRLRVGSYVLAEPLRTARATAWESHSLTQVTDGRFELGLGTGLPSMREQAEELGLPYGSARERLDSISATIDHVRELDGDTHTPVMLAVSGPKARRLAARKADIVTLSGPAMTDRAAFTAQMEEIRSVADGREVELGMNIFVVGDDVPPWIEGFIGADARTLIEQDAPAMIRGSVDDMVAELERRRSETGVSYVTVNGEWLEAFAPVVRRLTGR